MQQQTVFNISSTLEMTTCETFLFAS